MLSPDGNRRPVLHAGSSTAGRQAEPHVRGSSVSSRPNSFPISSCHDQSTLPRIIKSVLVSPTTLTVTLTLLVDSGSQRQG
jgi:hypothetical protein